jgi:hypothetical protein
MTFIEKVRKAIKTGQMPPIFSSADVVAVGIADPNHNLSNYDKKNLGSFNKKVLVSAEINGQPYYTLDEQIFE